MAIGENIKRLRQEKGITMHALAENAGITAPQIAKYEAGITCPNAISAVLIADQLGTTVEKLVNGDDDEGGEESAETVDT